MLTAQGMEALEVNEVSDDEFGGRVPGSGGLDDHLKRAQSRETSVLWRPQGRAGQAQAETPMCTRWTMGHGKDGHRCLTKVKRVSWAGGSRKLVGELCTVSCGSRNPVNLKPSCGSSESLLHNLGLENSTCVADMCFYVLNLGGSVVSDCGDTRAASGTGHVLEVADTKQMLFCRSEGTVGNPTCPLSAPNIDSPSWMCALTGQRREVAWFQMRIALY